MKALLFLYFFICYSTNLKSQSIEHNPNTYIPTAATFSSASIAQYVQANYTTNLQKLQAIYSWVTTNIRYSTDSMYNINWGPDPDLKVTAALRRKKGVCENFAAVFTDITLKCGIPSFVVTGYTNFSKTGHSWSAVQLDNAWFLCDPTWDINAGYNGKYFLIPPDQFIETHMPFDPLWQLLPHPISQQQFDKGFSSQKKETVAWNIMDSVKAFLQLDSLHRFEAASARMKQAGLQNNTATIWHSYVDMKIAIAYGDKDMELYNAATADLNKAAGIFNNYVNYRNNQFMPIKPDAAISALLEPIPNLISSAFKKLDKLGEKIENVQYDAGMLKSRLSALSTKVLEQQKFLKKYLESSVADRGKLFYQ